MLSNAAVAATCGEEGAVNLLHLLDFGFIKEGDVAVFQKTDDAKGGRDARRPH